MALQGGHHRAALGTGISPCVVNAMLVVQTADGRRQYISIDKYVPVYISCQITAISIPRCFGF
jgi:hypothetical protein